METKVCSKCGEIKPISEFALNKTKNDGHSSECKSCHKKYRDSHYKINKEYYINKSATYRKQRRNEFDRFKSTLKCSICGESRPWCLDFHHINPSEKDVEVVKLIESPRKLEEEIKKCVVLCANCHREIHYKERMQVSYNG